MDHSFNESGSPHGREIATQFSNNRPADVATTIEALADTGALRIIFEFLPGHFRFMAGVSRQWRRIYTLAHHHHGANPNKTATWHAVAFAGSDAAREIWWTENSEHAVEEGCALAAKLGNVRALRWLESRGCHRANVCEYAAAQGHVPVLVWAKVSPSQPYPMDDDAVFTLAAENGHLAVLQWCQSQTLHWKRLRPMGFRLAAAKGHLHVVKWLESQREDPLSPWDSELCVAAENGHLPVVAWLRSQQYPWSTWTVRQAAKNGHLHVVQWLRAQNPPCPWCLDACTEATRFGHLHVLQWLRSQTPPCPWDYQTCLALAPIGSETAEFIRSCRSQS